MKKLKHKLQRIVSRRAKEPKSVGRITNETVAEHREQVLAGGRRYKYPMQYARYSLVRNTIIISIGAIILLLLLGWWQLYQVQNTSRFFYRLSQLIPVPVASIDGETVRYSDYLMRLRSELHYLSREGAINFNTEDGKRQRDYQKRVALNRVEENAFVDKIADENNIRVSDKEVNDFIDQQLKSRQPAVTVQEYEKVIKDYYDWSFNEYKLFVYDQLLRRKVALAIDDKARTKSEAVLKRLKAGEDFAAIAKVESTDTMTKANGGDVGFVPKNTTDPEGLVAAVDRLQVNQLSGVIETNSGFYIVKLLERRGEEVRYARILIGLTELESRLQGALKNRVKEFIDVPKDVTPSRRQQ
ncbi:hypothetical protein CYG49_03770 [Candidatus Saccharibacteria bacterium]|nr:MAG: hypothetical protein CYG49_03770 [Candidatus Saccharibacteria bacterium]